MRLLLEDGTGILLLEDGSGGLLLEGLPSHADLDLTLGPCTLAASMGMVNAIDLEVTLGACTVAATVAVGTPYASDIDQAIVARLATDAELAALLPDGVWVDVPPIGAQRYAIVSLIDHDDVDQLQTTAYEVFSYLIKAVALHTSGADVVRSASSRMHDLLQGAPIAAPGYAPMACRRTQYLRTTEVDDVTDVRWQHRGGYYDVWVSPG
jgi:hypothetical protein